MGDIVKKLADGLGGRVTWESGPLSDGSGCAVMSLPLPKDHWSTRKGDNVPPMPFRVGNGLLRDELADAIRAAAKHAIRSSTLNGTENDFDPDAMVQNFVVGMLGYWTEDGLSGEDWGNPNPVPPLFGKNKP